MDATNETNRMNGHVNGHALELPTVKKKGTQWFEDGRVVTFIVPIDTGWNEVEFRIKQRRRGLDNSLSELLHPEDRWDAIHGLCKADRWIKERQRVRWWKMLVAALF